MTDLERIEQILQEDKGEVLCVISTTSCFAPRGYDLVPELAQLCKKYDTFHAVNNAYGI